jgi:hypothetical protein
MKRDRRDGATDAVVETMQSQDEENRTFKKVKQEDEHGGQPLIDVPGVPVVRPLGEIDARDVSYRGEYKEGRPHGRGYKVWVDGDWYEGEWRQGRQHGRGSTIS